MPWPSIGMKKDGAVSDAWTVKREVRIELSQRSFFLVPSIGMTRRALAIDKQIRTGLDLIIYCTLGATSSVALLDPGGGCLHESGLR
jgi:hypothetical protein